MELTTSQIKIPTQMDQPQIVESCNSSTIELSSESSDTVELPPSSNPDEFTQNIPKLRHDEVTNIFDKMFADLRGSSKTSPENSAFGSSTDSTARNYFTKCGEYFATCKEKAEHEENQQNCSVKDCLKCGESFTTYSEKQKHVEDRHHYPGWFCLCNKKFQQLSLFTSHSCLYKQAKSFSFKSLDGHYVNDKEIWQCKICKQLFFSEKVVKSHMTQCKSMVHGKFECNLCKSVFDRCGTLRHHYYECQTKLTLKINDLVEYLTVHKEITQVQCLHCSKPFSTSDLQTFRLHVVPCARQNNILLECVDSRFDQIRGEKKSPSKCESELSFGICELVKNCSSEAIDFDNLLPHGVVNPLVTLPTSPKYSVMVDQSGEVTQDVNASYKIVETKKTNSHEDEKENGTPNCTSTSTSSCFNKNENDDLPSSEKKTDSETNISTQSMQNGTDRPTFTAGVSKFGSKRRPKLITDKYISISREEMMSQIEDASDTVKNLDLGPRTKCELYRKNTAGVERIFAQPGRKILSTDLIKLFRRHLTIRPEETQEFDLTDNAPSPNIDRSEKISSNYNNNNENEEKIDENLKKNSAVRQKIKGTALPSVDHRYTNTVLTIESEEMKAITCERCGKVFDTFQKKKSHVIHRNHFDGWYCYPCRGRFSELSNFWAHSCAWKKKYSYSFTNWGDFSTGEVWQCGVCKQLFFSESVLHYHISKCVMMCRLCGSRFVNADEYRVHFDSCAHLPGLVRVNPLEEECGGNLESDEMVENFEDSSDNLLEVGSNVGEFKGRNENVGEDFPSSLNVLDPRTGSPQFQPHCVVNKLELSDDDIEFSTETATENESEEIVDFTKLGNETEDEHIQRENEFSPDAENFRSNLWRIDNGEFYCRSSRCGNVRKTCVKVCGRCGHGFPSQYFRAHPCNWLLNYLVGCRVVLRDFMKKRNRVKKARGKNKNNLRSHVESRRNRQKTQH